MITMRIIHVHKYYYERAGAERYMFDLMDLQEKAGHTVAPFSMHYPKNKPSIWSDYFVSELLTESGIGGLPNAWRQFWRALWSLEAYRNISKMIDVFAPDIVHIHNINNHISPSVLLACARHKIPVVMSVHDYSLVSANYSLLDGEKTMDWRKLGVWQTAKTRFIKGSFLATLVLELIRVWHKLTGAYTKRIAHYFANSSFTKQVLVASGYSENRISVLFPFFEKEELQIFRNDQGYVLYLGRLEKYKGVQTLIEVAKQLPNIQYKITGNGTAESYFRALAKGLDNVEFTGWVSGTQKKELIAGARVGVVPSIWHEPAGVVIFEQMCVGVPVIVSNRGGMLEIVEDNVSGEIFEAGNVEELKTKIQNFYNDGNLAKKMEEAAKDRAHKIGGAKEHLEKVMLEYKRLVEKVDK